MIGQARRHGQDDRDASLHQSGAPAILRAMREHILEHADIVGHDAPGREIMRFEFPVEPWMMDKLAALGAGREELEPEEDANVASTMDRVA
jgi:hypothetical protein